MISFGNLLRKILIGISSESSKPIEPRMYLVLREDLAFKYIQGSHAFAQYAIDQPEKVIEWNNQYLICLSVFNGLALEDLKAKLINIKGFPYFSLFYEPDLKSESPTALCVFDDGKNGVREHFKDLQLASK